MKKTGLACLILVCAVSVGWGQELLSVTRLGGNFSTEFSHSPSVGQIKDSFLGGDAAILPAFELEALSEHFGFNFRTSLMFHSANLNYPDLKRSWVLDARPEFGLRYHFFGWDAFLDPYVEGNVGVGTMVDITGAKASSAYKPVPFQLGWFAGVGAGLNLVFDQLYVGGTFKFYPINAPLPATNFAEYGIGRFAFSIHVGFNIERWVERTLFGYQESKGR